jgi:hypothetical protein
VLMFLYGVPHETTVLARVKENIVWCWFCGFGLFGPWPDHCALYDFRRRVGAACFEEILTLVVQTCLEAGLVSNELLSFDLTPVVASGHRWSPYERAVILTRALIRYLELSWAEQRPSEPFPEALRLLAAEVALEVLLHETLDTVKPEGVVDSVERWTAESEPQHPKGTRPWQVEVEAAVEAVGTPDESPAPLAPDDARLRPRLVLAAKALLAHLPHTRGDADARVGRTTSYTWFCGYLLGFAMDSAQHIITALEPVSHRRWQENRQHSQTEEYKVAQGQRFVEEGRFGLAKTNHHGAKAPYRNQAMNEIAGLMIAIVMNYRVLARHQAKERRVLAA